MSLFNRKQAAQGFEMLAGICGLFAFLATNETLVMSGASERPFAILLAGTGVLSAAAGLVGNQARIAIRAFLNGPFIACVMLAAAIPFTEPAVSIYAENRLVAASAFAAAASVLFMALRTLRDR
jgi:hypothetical protein